MSNSVKIINDWKKGVFSPVYWFEGDESYFIDQLLDYAEHKILSETEASFNLTIHYGKDSTWQEVVNSCMKYPMFAERQLVILKEAQQLKELDMLENYISKPLSSTIFIVAHKHKKIDGRTKLSKVLKKYTVHLNFEKVKEHRLFEVVHDQILSKGLTVTDKALLMLIENIGSDLSRINNELEKIIINLGGKKEITEGLVEEFIGISKDYNVFELKASLAAKNIPKSLKIIQYFIANPKSGSIHSVIPVLYSFFSGTLLVTQLKGMSPKEMEAETGLNYYGVKDALQAIRHYNVEQLEKIIILLHHFNLRSLGVGDTGSSDPALLKELIMKIALC